MKHSSILMFLFIFFALPIVKASEDCAKTGLAKLEHISEDEFNNLKEVLTLYLYPGTIDRCFFEKGKHYELAKAVDEIIEGREKNFIQSQFAQLEIARIQTQYPLAWEDVDSPLEIYTLLKLLNERTDKTVLNRDQIRKFYFEHSQTFRQLKKKWQEYQTKKSLPKRIAHSLYIIELIDKQEKAFELYNEFKQNGFAKDENDFYSNLLNACYEIECSEKFLNSTYSKYGRHLKSFQADQGLDYLLKYNNLEGIKKFISKSNYALNTENVSQIIHLPDTTIQHFFAEDLLNYGGKKIIDLDVYDEMIGDIAIGKFSRNYLNLETTHKYYGQFFINKHKQFSAKHPIGSVTFNASTILSDQREFPSEKDSYKYEGKVYGFEEPSWESNHKVVYSRKNDGYFGGVLQLNNLSGRSFDFDEFKGNWLHVQMEKEKYWIHVSQIEEIQFLHISFKDDSKTYFDPDEDEIYYTINGKKLPRTPQSETYYKYTIHEAKWQDKELWLQVSLTRESCNSVVKEKLENKKFWIKAFVNGHQNPYNVSYSEKCIVDGEI